MLASAIPLITEYGPPVLKYLIDKFSGEKGKKAEDISEKINPFTITKGVNPAPKMS